MINDGGGRYFVSLKHALAIFSDITKFQPENLETVMAFK